MSFLEKNLFGMPKGWKDLGNVVFLGESTDNWGNKIRKFEVCGRCRKRTRVGKEDGKAFTSCPQVSRKTCLSMINPKQTEELRELFSRGALTDMTYSEFLTRIGLTIIEWEDKHDQELRQQGEEYEKH